MPGEGPASGVHPALLAEPGQSLQDALSYSDAPAADSKGNFDNENQGKTRPMVGLEDSAEGEVSQNSAAATLFAPLLHRLGAAAIDSALVSATLGLCLVAAAFAFGPEELFGLLGRGFDYVLDGLLIGRKLAPILLGLSALLFTLYSTLCHAVFGATLGKYLLGLSVQNQIGAPPSFRDSFWRSVFGSCFVVLGGLGPAWLVMDPARHALHDRLVGTRVFRREDDSQ